MSLYDDDISDNQAVAGWSSGIKLLQSHVQLKKATSTHAQRKADKKQVVAPVLDLNRKENKISSEDMPPIPLYVPKGAPSLLGGDWHLKDEYDPMYPNDYDRLVKQLRREYKKTAEKDDPNSPASKRQSIMIAPPPNLDPGSPPKPAGASFPPPPPPPVEVSPMVPPNRDLMHGATAVASNMGCSSVAAKIMAKMGFKAGQGLGKSEQGMSAALVVEKTSHRGGKIIERTFSAMQPPPSVALPDDLPINDEAADVLPPPAAPPLPTSEPQEQSITEMMKNPTRVVLLKNMVGPGEVDADLEPETKEECSKYGEVVRCVIYELPGPNIPVEEAVRIFIEFKTLGSAIKAVVDLNGRFFGGRVVRASFYDHARFARLDLL